MLTATALKIPIIYSESYYVDIGEHVFPTSKYRLLKRRIDLDESLKGKFEFFEPAPASKEEIMAVHDKEYIDKLENGTLTEGEIFTMEIPYSKSLVDASVTCCGGTLTASMKALERKAAVHLGGGFHHSFADHGEGFCVLNDIAVSVRAMQSGGKIKKALIIDCDLHQGNGTAQIFMDDPSVYTFSIHQKNNYPFHKPKGSMDIELEDYTRDDVYLEYLYDNVPKVISEFKPDVILYLAGADPYKGDQLGNLSLSKDGLKERDNYICTQAHNYEVPIAVTLAGGYAANREDTVDIHFNTVKECVDVFYK